MVARDLAMPFGRAYGLARGPHRLPLGLFEEGCAGGFWLPTPATCFKDLDGTQAALWGDAVARLSDLSANGNDAIQETVAARPTLGRRPGSGARNLTTLSNQFDLWEFRRVLRTPGTIAGPAPLGGTGTLIVDDSSIDQALVFYQATNVTQQGEELTASIYVKQATSPNFTFNFQEDGETGVLMTFDFVDGVPVLRSVPSEITQHGVEAIGTSGWYRIWGSTVAHRQDAGVQLRIFPMSREGSDYSASGQGTYIFGAQLEHGNTVTAYQEAPSAFDITEIGVPSLPYLSFDGVDDFLQSNASIDLSGFEAATTVVAMERLDNAETAHFFNHGNQADGTLAVMSLANEAQFGAYTRETGLHIGAITDAFPAPSREVITAEMQRGAGSLIRLRRNGVVMAENTTPLTGHARDAVATLFARPGGEKPAHGRLYGCMLIGGGLAGSVDLVEAALAERAGVGL